MIGMQPNLPMSVDDLNQPIFTRRDAARLAGMTADTLKSWERTCILPDPPDGHAWTHIVRAATVHGAACALGVRPQLIAQAIEPFVFYLTKGALLIEEIDNPALDYLIVARRFNQRWGRFQFVSILTDPDKIGEMRSYDAIRRKANADAPGSAIVADQFCELAAGIIPLMDWRIVAHRRELDQPEAADARRRAEDPYYPRDLNDARFVRAAAARGLRPDCDGDA